MISTMTMHNGAPGNRHLLTRRMIAPCFTLRIRVASTRYVPSRTGASLRSNHVVWKTPKGRTLRPMLQEPGSSLSRSSCQRPSSSLFSSSSIEEIFSHYQVAEDRMTQSSTHPMTIVSSGRDSLFTALPHIGKEAADGIRWSICRRRGNSHSTRS